MESKKARKYPDPKELFEQAREELVTPIITDYIDTVRLLKERGWSYRRIAKWLTDHGVPASFNQVYYAAAPLRKERLTLTEADLTGEEMEEMETQRRSDDEDLKSDKVREANEREQGLLPKEDD